MAVASEGIIGFLVVPVIHGFYPTNNNVFITENM